MTHPARATLAAISLARCGLSAAACVVSYARLLAFVDAQFFYYDGVLWDRR